MSSEVTSPSLLRRVGSVLRGSPTVPRTRWSAPHVWRPTPGSLLWLLVGLWLFGTGEAFLLAARLGATPWTVLAQGMSIRTGWSIGWATFAISCVVLALWVPLRQRPGLGTVMNIIVISFALDVMYDVLPEPDGYGLRLLFVVVGIALIGLGSGLYLTAGHGPGPRDGLMTGLHWRTGRPVGPIRLGIEVSVLVVGWLLGGIVGVGTLLFALFIGQAVALNLRLVDRLSPPVRATAAP